MAKYSSAFVAIALGLIMAVAAGPVHAWELDLGGFFTWEYESAAQWGDAGLFGWHDTDAGGTDPLGGNGNAEQVNSYLGLQAAGGQTVSGHDAALVTQYAGADIGIKINKALKIDGNYYIGSWAGPNDAAVGELVASEYKNSSRGGVQRSFSPGYWNYLRLKAELPWGSLSVGKRPSRFGMGLWKSGDEDTSSESCSLGVKYGPLKFGLSFYPAREGDDYYNENDRSAIRELNFSQSVLYLAGPIEMGYEFDFTNRHRGPERTIGGAGTWRYREDIVGKAYVKYNNGRFFFNAEYDEFDRRVTQNAAPEYVDHFRYAVEGGMYAGPMKLSLIHGRATGRERRGGAYFDTDPYADTANTLVYLPYSYMMVYNIGLGDEPRGTTGNGMAIGASVFGARIDHAVAANLNVFLSGFYAIRPDKGYGWGYLTPYNWEDAGGDTTRTPAAVANVDMGTVGFGAWAGSPAIPDDFLGWEVDTGIDWQLLEGYLLTWTVAYWQPGDWFKHAAVSKQNPSWKNPAADPTGLFGTVPNRGLDPIWGMNILLTGEF